ncbi:TniQ family protein [Pseudomonas shirazica]|uniref:TniQ family protein n=1 Tax=Pseudomonas shirazica TaxID=1940636 RepID=UPI003AAF4A49
METSYTWHPGARCVNPRWPLTPPILPDELFSSWLVRTAHAHGCLPSSLTGAVWPGSHAWSVDPDRAHPWANLDRLSGMSGLSSHQLLASTLWPVMQRLHPRPCSPTLNVLALDIAAGLPEPITCRGAHVLP